MTLQNRILAVLAQGHLVTVQQLIALLNVDGHGVLYPDRNPRSLANAMTKALKALEGRHAIWRVEDPDGNPLRYRGSFKICKEPIVGYPRPVNREAALELFATAREIKLKRHTLITGEDWITTLEPAKARYFFERTTSGGMQEIMPGVFAFLLTRDLPSMYHRIELHA